MPELNYFDAFRSYNQPAPSLPGYQFAPPPGATPSNFSIPNWDPNAGQGFNLAPSLGANAGGPGNIWDSLQSWIGTKDAPGPANFALGAGGAMFNAWLGMKQYGLAKKTLEQNTRQFDLNYDAQKQTTNTALEDRQRARVASNPGAYQSVGDYMNKNGIK